MKYISTKIYIAEVGNGHTVNKLDRKPIYVQLHQRILMSTPNEATYINVGQ